MITETTSLILGAGASAPYGFPSGVMLTGRIVGDLANRQSETYQMMVKLGYSGPEIDSFRTSLHLSGKTSVDAFLEHRPEFLELGKAAIAASLIPHERADLLHGAQDGWYGHLLAALDARPTDFRGNRLSVITFNYDRSLETYLHTALSHSHGIESTKAASQLRNVPIIHVHGKLGRLPWETGPEPPRPYGPEVSQDAVEAGRDTIRIIHEGVTNDSVLREASSIINSSERVVFVGFGFHPQNLERLTVDLDMPRKFIGGSCLGFTNLERASIGRKLPQGFVWGYKHWKTLEFLREKVELR